MGCGVEVVDGSTGRLAVDRSKGPWRSVRVALDEQIYRRQCTETVAHSAVAAPGGETSLYHAGRHQSTASIWGIVMKS